MVNVRNTFSGHSRNRGPSLQLFEFSNRRTASPKIRQRLFELVLMLNQPGPTEQVSRIRKYVAVQYHEARKKKILEDD